MVVGGSKIAENRSLSIYRGDSFVCGVAIHTGIFSNYHGGSGVVSLVGGYNDFSKC